MPKVSIIVPNYNHAPFLSQRLGSIFAQTLRDFEVILLDDASTDNSVQALEIAGKDQRVKTLILNTENSGSPFKQWNRGARHASGEYLWFAESDDYADSHFLEVLVHFLDQHPSVGIAYCDSYEIDEFGTLLGGCQYEPDLDTNLRWKADFLNKGKDECRDFLVAKNTIPNASAVLLRHEVFHAVGGANESFLVSGDWDLWIRMLMVSDVAFLARPLNYFRQHRGTVRQTKTRSVIRESVRVVANALDLTQASIVSRKSAFVRIARWWAWCLARGDIALETLIEEMTTIHGLDDRVDEHMRSAFIGVSMELWEYSQNLERGKQWLTDQLAIWQAEAQRRDKVIAELKGWIEELEQGKAWLERQWKEWQGVAEERAQTIADLQRRLDQA